VPKLVKFGLLVWYLTAGMFPPSDSHK